jgi:hypothetical protein
VQLLQEVHRRLWAASCTQHAAQCIVSIAQVAATEAVVWFGLLEALDRQVRYGKLQFLPDGRGKGKPRLGGNRGRAKEERQRRDRKIRKRE